MALLRLLVALILSHAIASQNDMIQEAPPTGVVLRDQPGLLITDAKTYSTKVYYHHNSKAMFKKHVKALPAGMDMSSDARHFVEDILEHADSQATLLFRDLQKYTLAEEDLARVAGPRQKRFVGAILTAISAVGTLFNLGATTLNTISIRTLRQQIAELQDDRPHIQNAINKQLALLQGIGETLRKTVVVVNAHSNLLNETRAYMTHLAKMMEVDMAHSQIVQMLTRDNLMELSSSTDALSMGRIPSHLVPLTLVQGILSRATGKAVSLTQATLAYSLGGAIPLTVDPPRRELSFLLTLPVMENENIYRTKAVTNTGGWHGGNYVRVNTPEIVAYHDRFPSLFLAPNLKLCTLVRDIHYLCPSKPFVRDNTNGICGLTPMTNEGRCLAETTTREKVIETRAEIVEGRWLVTTPADSAIIRYDIHDTSARIDLPPQTFWLKVPEGAIVHIGEMALYYLPVVPYQTELEVSSFFDSHEIQFDSTTLRQMQEGGTQTIELTTLDDAIIQAKATIITDKHFTVTGSWSASDTLLAVLLLAGYLVTAGLAFWFGKKYVNMRKCNDNLRSRCLREDPEVAEAPPGSVRLVLSPFLGDSGTASRIQTP